MRKTRQHVQPAQAAQTNTSQSEAEVSDKGRLAQRRRTMRRTGAMVIAWYGILACAAAHARAQDDCATAPPAPWGGPGVALDVCLDQNPTGPAPAACYTGNGILDVWATFVAETTAARVRTDIGSVGTDSVFVVYEVDQADICNAASWVELACSDNEASLFLGDITVQGLTVGDTYLVQLGSWADDSGCEFTVTVEEGIVFPPLVPTVSEWGLLNLSLFLLAAGSVMIARRTTGDVR